MATNEIKNAMGIVICDMAMSGQIHDMLAYVLGNPARAGRIAKGN